MTRTYKIYIIQNRTKKFYIMLGGEFLRIDKKKYMLARARACMGQKELEEAGIPRGTICRVLNSEVRPETAGRIAKALGVDVTEILEDQTD